MSETIQLQPALVLHTRPFRNTSLLVDFICPDHGRLRAVARGARRAGSRYRGLLQLFQPLLISLRGRGELLTLTDAENAGKAVPLSGVSLFTGLYLNELLTRLLPTWQPVEEVFASYHQTLLALSDEGPPEPVLRYFEYDLLVFLGYGFDLYQDHRSGDALSGDRRYLFSPGSGFEEITGSSTGTVEAAMYSGEALLALRERRLKDMPEHLPAIKRLMRQALREQLGGRPLQSREYFLSRRPPG